MDKTFFGKIFFCTILFTIFFSVSVCADELEEQMEIAGVDGLNQVSEGAKEFDEEFDFGKRVREEIKGENTGEDGTDILSRIFQIFVASLKSGISETSKIMLAVFLFGIIMRFVPEGAAQEAAFYATYAVLFAMALFLFNEAAKTASDIISEMNFFVKAAVPVMCTLAVPTGKMVSTAGTAGIIGGICVVTEAAAKILIPLTGMMAALAATNNLSREVSLQGLERLIKKIVMWSIGIVMTVFVSLLKIRGIAGGSLDNITGRTIKFALGNMVPVVGGIISDSLDNIVAYSRAIAGSCGAVGIIALLYMILPPVLKISGMLVAFRLTGIITSPVADGRISGAIDNFSDILGIVLMITVVVCILFITAMGSLAI